MTTVFIEVRGGVVVSVQSTEPIEYCIIDWDNEQIGEPINFTKYESDRITTEKEIKKDFKRK
jgi:hypothetical protein